MIGVVVTFRSDEGLDRARAALVDNGIGALA